MDGVPYNILILDGLETEVVVSVEKETFIVMCAGSLGSDAVVDTS